MPPCRSSPRLMGTRRTVVSFMRPVFWSSTRWVVLRGTSAITANAVARAIQTKRQRSERMRLLEVEGLSRRHPVALELLHERLAGRKRLHVAQAAHPLHSHRLAVQVAGEVEQVNLERPRRDSERGARALIHHPPEPLSAPLHPHRIYPVGAQQLSGVA